MRLRAICLLCPLLAIALAACAGAPVLRLTPESRAVTRATAAATALVYPTLTPHVFCAGTMESFLIVGERGRVKLTEAGKWLNLRAAPGIESDLIGRLAPLDDFLVLAGARCEGDYTWYQVDYRGAVGWIAEGGAGEYYAEPWLPG